MFDEEKKQPEDMFEVTDKVAPQLTAPTDEPMPQAAPAQDASAFDALSPSPKAHFPWKAIVFVVAILVIVGAAFFLSMRILGSRTPATPVPPPATTQPSVQAEDTQQAVEEEEAQPVPEEEPEPVVSRVDTDKDGLTDQEEQELGTSPQAVDTDDDRLFDREEVRTWETDPLNPDTDGDGYLDGEEVKAGYNPNGEGALREPPSESS